MSWPAIIESLEGHPDPDSVRWLVVWGVRKGEKLPVHQRYRKAHHKWRPADSEEHARSLAAELGGVVMRGFYEPNSAGHD
jgi:hypothetical protein